MRTTRRKNGDKFGDIQKTEKDGVKSGEIDMTEKDDEKQLERDAGGGEINTT